MEFLVQVDGSRVYTLPADERDDLIRRERERGRQLLDEGVIQQFWRIPGRRGNVGIWSAVDADALEEALTSLPIWPYADIEVTALATHPMIRQR
ncbi:muconolactone Delta-isomerase [Streptomyces pinistramenti]|uniref:muconolactone Delta-isomerase n=1 Tax=Streptomyces pinistramenti TaxID=2884812 RepID=UPI001D0788E6|nr:muconolactone Delta-isomerase family protein [Streptomyces pinistramenti]MCB5905918.1 muconolactone Delta-isomerase family protein [Streptomyces pinistramenti]